MACDCSTNTVQDGSNGYNAFTTVATTLTASFVANGTTQYTVVVTNNQTSQYTGKWAVAGQTIYIATLGSCTVVSSTSTTIIFTIPTYNTTSFPATLVAGSKISPAGQQGAAGTAATAYGRILYANETPASTSGVSGDVLHTYTIPAATLTTNSDMIVVRSMFVTNTQSTNLATKYGTLTFGASILTGDFATIAINPKDVLGYYLTTYITRTSNTAIAYTTELNQLASFFSGYTNTYAGMSFPILILKGTITGLNLTTTTYDVAVTGYNAVAGQVTSKFLNIEYIPKV